MAIIQGNAKQGSTRGFYPKVINGSLRFNDDDSAYLSWTPDSAGDQKTWTWSGWVKRGNLGTTQQIFGATPSTATGNTTWTSIIFIGDALRVGGFNTQWRITTQVFRDPSAWYHIVVAWDTTQATANDRVKVYVNGVEVTSFSTLNNPTLNTNYAVNSTVPHVFGARQTWASDTYLDAYLAEVNFLNGIAATADDFGELKSGVWIPKEYTGAYDSAAQVTAGNLNGFRLSFEDDTQVEAFNTVLYRGNGQDGHRITGTGFQPDLVWIKRRDGSASHRLFDAVRGATAGLKTNGTDAEYTTSNWFKSFDSDGFTLDDDGTTYEVNYNGWDYVAWCWKAGDSNVSNTDGTITSTVRANDTYGFSIVSYTGTGPASAANEIQVGHGLSSAPKLVIVKNRSNTSDWFVFTTVIDGSNDYLYLNQTAAKGDSGNNAPTSDVFYAGGSLNTSGNNYIAYCWAEKTGYSKFGSYNGNNSTNGPEIDCGFIPSMVILKRTDSAGSWTMYDTTRDTDGTLGIYLYPHLSNNEPTDLDTIRITRTADGDTYDGFKLVRAGTDINGTASTEYIFAAFADTREAAFWLDQSGNDNDWQPVNLDHNDTVADSPTDNFATWNPLAKLGSVALPTFSDGNLTLTTNASVDTMAVATMGITSGTFYYEATLRSANTYHQFGVASKTDSITTSTDRVTYFGFNGYIYNNSTATSGYGANSAGDVLRVACDADAGTVKFYLNTTLLSTESWTSNTGLYIPFMAGSNGTGYIADVNFGQQPFTYDPPA